MRGNGIRTGIVVVLLTTTWTLLQVRGSVERTPKAEPMATFPGAVEGWRSTDHPISPEVRTLLGPGDFLDRAYRRDNEPVVDLFLAYFPSQRTGSTMHSPKHCLPGSGWEFASSNRVPLQLPGMPPLRVNESILAKGPEKLFVLYWYQAHGRGVASEYLAKFYLVADVIRLNRTDGALVRYTTPILPGETPGDARRRVLGLASLLSPHFKDYIPE